MGLSFGLRPLYPGQLSNNSAETATIGSASTLTHPHAPSPSWNHVPHPEKGPTPSGSTVIASVCFGADDVVLVLVTEELVELETVVAVDAALDLGALDLN